MKILSLFDGMSCWQIALNKLWITDYTYYASEIDKFAIQVTQENYPNTIQVWNIKHIDWKDYKWIDLMMWWSPCQWFSFAWKQLNFEDERSKLFFEFVRILNEAKPKYFILENVKMKKEFQNIISDYLWIEPVEINSALVSAQNRGRLYWIWELQKDWTYKNVNIEQPEDKWIFLKDILENKVNEKYYMTYKQFHNLWYESLQRLYFNKAPTLNTAQWWHRQPKILVNRYNNRFMTDKSWTLWAYAWFTNKQGYQVFEWDKIRKLTPLEYERLQTVPDWYTQSVSDSQRYKMLWNWFTVDIIKHILSYIIK